MGGLAIETETQGRRKASTGRRGYEVGSLCVRDCDLNGVAKMEKVYQYRESGLDSVFLVNGFEYHNSPRGRTVSIQDVEGLHKTIGLTLAQMEKRLTGKEFRYLRVEMLLSQASLAKVLGVRELTVSRWEKEETEIPVATEAVVREMYLDSIGEGGRIRELLEKIADLDDRLDEAKTIRVRKPKKNWEVVGELRAA